MSEDACTASTIGLLLGAHLDGELDPIKTLEVESHLAKCEVCRERLALDRALRGSLKKAVKRPMPEDVRARMLTAIGGESAREARRDQGDGTLATSSAAIASAAAIASHPTSNAAALDASVIPAASGGRGASGEAPAPRTRPSMLRHWRTVLPLASAAAVVMAWGAAGNQPVLGGMPDIPVSAGNDLLRDFVAQHSRPVPPEQADPKQVRQFERYVGVPVHVPHFAQNAKFVGARLVPVHGGERAVMLQYEMAQNEGHSPRLTVFVYDPRKIQIGGANLAARAVGTAEVRFGRTDGYSVAVTQHGGVGYAMTSDLDPESSAKLAAFVDHE